MVTEMSEKAFLLVTTGRGNVACIHQCFVHREPGSNPAIIGVLGGRRSSPFKGVSLEEATRRFTGARTTRATNTGEEEWVPSAEDFMACKGPEEFKRLTETLETGKKSRPDVLWQRAQTFFVHPMVFGEFMMGKQERAANVAMRIISRYPDKAPMDDSDDDESESDWRSPKALHEILLHL